MPPVLGPWSPSKARLWSWLESMGTTCFPSQKASTVTSGPVMHSSMTTAAPLLPNLPPSIMSLRASCASATVAATVTPLPRARPSAFTTMGAPCSSTYRRAAERSVKVLYLAVGMRYFFISSLEKALLASMMAALARGPKAGMPAASKASTMPRARGSSGATMTKSTAFSLA